MGVSKSWSLEVATRSGRLRGDTDLTDTVAWRGIPFGAPPTGDRRWRAPRDPEAWTGVRQAIGFGSAPWMPGAEHSSEDCLSLNVWRPADAEAGLPVYVWLSGGGNQIQMPRISDTPGHLVASRSRVVFVSISYRVGEMGWLSHPALRDGDPLDGSGNYGTLDIIKGLEWVRDNIDAFGGDPGNVLIFGQSGGGGQNNGGQPRSDATPNAADHRRLGPNGLEHRRACRTDRHHGRRQFLHARTHSTRGSRRAGER